MVLKEANQTEIDDVKHGIATKKITSNCILKSSVNPIPNPTPKIIINNNINNNTITKEPKKDTKKNNDDRDDKNIRRRSNVKKSNKIFHHARRDG